MGNRMFCQKYLPGARALDNVRISFLWLIIIYNHSEATVVRSSIEIHKFVVFVVVFLFFRCIDRLCDRQYFFPKRSKRDNVTGLYSTTIIGLIKSTDVDNEADIDCVLKIPGTDYVRSARNSVNDSNNGTFWLACFIWAECFPPFHFGHTFVCLLHRFYVIVYRSASNIDWPLYLRLCAAAVDANGVVVVTPRDRHSNNIN